MHRLAHSTAALGLLALASLVGVRAQAGAPRGAAIGVDSVALTTGQFLAAYVSPEPTQRERAEMYLVGLMDAGEGRLWCDYRTYKTVTLRERVFMHLKSLPSARLNEPAGEVVPRLLAQHYPCG